MAQSLSRSQRNLQIYEVQESMVLLFLIHLLTLQVGEAVAGRNKPEFSGKNLGEIVLDELVTANATLENASKISNPILSNLDQDVDQSRNVIVDVRDEGDLEKLKNVIAEYEPQKITSRKARRKLVNAPKEYIDDLHEVDTAVGSTTSLEKTYHELLRNISRNVPELVMNDTDVTSNPYLSQAMKSLKQIYIPKRDSNRVKKVEFDVGSSSILTKRKPKKFTKKYLQPNHTIATSRVSSAEELKVAEQIADGDKPSRSKKYLEAPQQNIKQKNSSVFESLSGIYSDPMRRLKKLNTQWNNQGSSTQIVSPFTLQLNNSNAFDVFTVNNLNNEQSNFPNIVKAVNSPSRYNVVPKPFAVSRFPNTHSRTSIPEVQILHSLKSNSSPTGFNYQPFRPYEEIPSIVFPTNLSNSSSIYRYIPTKHANQFNLNENATIVTEANTPASSIAGRTSLEELNADYAPYANVIGITRTPSVAINSHERSDSSDYYAITENPMDRIIAKTKAPAAYRISETSSLHNLHQQKNPQTVYKNGFVPRLDTYRNPKESDSKTNTGFELYNNIAKLYFPNLSYLPKAITQDYRDKEAVSPSHTLTSQQVSALPYETLKSVPPTSLKIRPIAFVRPLAPYYDSELIIPMQKIDRKELNDEKDRRKSIETKEQSQIEDADEEELLDDISYSKNDETQINHGNDKIYKTPNGQYEKKNREQDYYQKQEHDYGQHKYHIDDDDEREKYHKSRHENNEDEDDADETQEKEHFSNRNNERKYIQHNHSHQHEYDRDDPEEVERDEVSYESKKSNKQEDRNKESDDVKSSVKHEGISNNRHSNRYFQVSEKNEEYRDRNNQKEPVRDNRRKEKRRGHHRRHKELDEEEDIAEDKAIVQHSKDPYSRRQREKYEERNNDGHRRKYHREQIVPRRNLYRKENKAEESSETSPKHIRREYQKRGKGEHHHRHDNRDQNDDKEKVHDHVHGETQEHAHKHQEHKEHHEEKKDDGDHEFKEGEGAEHEEEHHNNDGEKGHKGYKAWHENENAEKGYHDKEHAYNEYDEKDGEEKKQEEEDGYHEEHHHDEKGEKAAEFGEKGEHKKGHSTKGEHSVHKKDEYEKKTEFFDESHEGSDVEKTGGYHHEHESEKGGHEKKGHHDEADHEDKYGEEKKFEKGGDHHEHKGHKVDEGHDHHYDHAEDYGKKEEHKNGKKWTFKKGDEGGGAK